MKTEQRKCKTHLLQNMDNTASSPFCGPAQDRGCKDKPSYLATLFITILSLHKERLSMMVKAIILFFHFFFFSGGQGLFFIFLFGFVFMGGGKVWHCYLAPTKPYSSYHQNKRSYTESIYQANLVSARNKMKNEELCILSNRSSPQALNSVLFLVAK